jgi:hypothetical protein
VLGDAVLVEVTHDFESPYHAGQFLAKAIHSLAGAFAAANPTKAPDEALALINSGITDELDSIRAREASNPTRGH